MGWRSGRFGETFFEDLGRDQSRDTFDEEFQFDVKGRVRAVEKDNFIAPSLQNIDRTITTAEITSGA